MSTRKLQNLRLLIFGAFSDRHICHFLPIHAIYVFILHASYCCGFYNKILKCSKFQIHFPFIKRQQKYSANLFKLFAVIFFVPLRTSTYRLVYFPSDEPNFTRIQCQKAVVAITCSIKNFFRTQKFRVHFLTAGHIMLFAICQVCLMTVSDEFDRFNIPSSATFERIWRELLLLSLYRSFVIACACPVFVFYSGIYCQSLAEWLLTLPSTFSHVRVNFVKSLRDLLR